MTTAKDRRNTDMLQSSVAAGTVVVTSTGMGRFQHVMLDGRHVLFADELVAAGGNDTGPDPYELLLMALGSCTSMTLHLYAAGKRWPLQQVVVTLSQDHAHARDCANCDDRTAMIHRIRMTVELLGALDDTQRARLLEIADKCPVHRTLTSRIEIGRALTPAAQ